MTLGKCPHCQRRWKSAEAKQRAENYRLVHEDLRLSLRQRAREVPVPNISYSSTPMSDKQIHHRASSAHFKQTAETI